MDMDRAKEILILRWWRKICVVLIVAVIFFVLTRCATGPRNMAEMNPRLGSEAGEVLVVVKGTASARIFFFDRAGALVQDWSEAGASAYFTVNDQADIRVYLARLPLGYYQVEIRPYYFTAIFRQAAELPIRRTSVRVDGRVDTYENKYTMRHWDAVLNIQTGKIPNRHMVGPKVNVSGTGPFKILLNAFSGGR
ncbi:MAG: hypothetical protein PHC85_03115 [Candidatus Pacebacteria bacterium]|nr:hypothetical protein [Candidatus Paceibacterota bacterium]